jgi:hypothetical protein
VHISLQFFGCGNLIVGKALSEGGYSHEEYDRVTGLMLLFSHDSNCTAICEAENAVQVWTAGQGRGVRMLPMSPLQCEVLDAAMVQPMLKIHGELLINFTYCDSGVVL